jgi:hypothetical protein
MRMTDAMAPPEQFRKFAELCVRLAKEPGDATNRAQLLEMAEAWRGLAAEAERLEQLILEVDQAFDIPGAEEPARRVQRRSH